MLRDNPAVYVSLSIGYIILFDGHPFRQNNHILLIILIFCICRQFATKPAYNRGDCPTLMSADVSEGYTSCRRTYDGNLPVSRKNILDVT